MPSNQSLETDKSVKTAQTLRTEISYIVSCMAELHKKTTRSVRSAAKNYRGLIELEKRILRIGKNAADWPDEIFRYRKPGEASRHFAICCFAKEFRLASQSLVVAPNVRKCQEGSTFESAFKSFKYLHESWEYPERFEEIDLETVEYEAATDVDFDDEPGNKGTDNA